MKGAELPTSLIFWIIVFFIVVVLFIGLAMWTGEFGEGVIDVIPDFI